MLDLFTPVSTQKVGYGSDMKGLSHRGLERQGDAGWGVATKDPKFSVFQYEWREVMGAPGVRERKLRVVLR